MEFQELFDAEDFLFLSAHKLKVERIKVAEDRWSILISVGRPQRIFTVNIEVSPTSSYVQRAAAAQAETFLRLIDGGHNNLGLLFVVS